MIVNRRDFLKTTGMVAVASMLYPGVGHAKSRGLFTPIRRGTGTFQGQGGTIGWFVSDNAVVLVDSQFPDTAADCLEGIQKKTSREIDFLLNTHHHGDHTAGNPTLRPHTKNIVAHENVPVLQKAAAERGNSDRPQEYANIVFENEWRQDLGDEIVTMKHYGSAHTGGDTVTHFEKADVVHVGDLVFNRVPAYVDLAGGSDTMNWINVLEQIHDDFSDDTIFVYGHGHSSHGITGTRADVLEARDFLTELREYVQKGVSADKPVDDLLIESLHGFESYFMEDRPTTLHGRIRSVYTEISGRADN